MPQSWVALFAAAAVMSAALAGGCTYSGGELLFMLGFGKGKKIEARFRLTEGPVLIFVDDVEQRVDWPLTKQHLTDALAQELLKQKAATKIVPEITLQQIKQTDPGFGKLSCRQVGERTGAEQVLWLEVLDFLVQDEILDGERASYLTVSVKVINALEKEDRRRVRLWPTGVAGHIVTASLAGGDVLRLKTKDAVSEELTGKLAERIAKLFYDHRLGPFEKEQ